MTARPASAAGGSPPFLPFFPFPIHIPVPCNALTAAAAEAAALQFPCMTALSLSFLLSLLDLSGLKDRFFPFFPPPEQRREETVQLRSFRPMFFIQFSGILVQLAGRCSRPTEIASYVS